VRTILTITALMGSLASSSAVAQRARPSSDSIRTILQHWITTRTSTGLIAGVLDGDSVRIVGVGRRGGIGSPTPDDSTTFEIGSITKVMVGTLLADMVLRGEVALDDPVQRYLPAAVRMPTGANRAITLRDLATHFSGLPRVADNLKPADAPGGNEADNYTASQLYAFLSSHTLRRDPGSAFEYSNLGMGLLGHVLSLRAGKSVGQLFRERIFEPLGMNDSYIPIEGIPAVVEANGHSEDLEPAPAWGRKNSVLVGAGGVRSSIRDMVRFARAVVNPDTTNIGRALALAITPIVAQSATDSTGLAWSINVQGPPAAWHNGGTGGFSSMMVLEPSRRRGAIVLSATYTTVDQLAWHLLDPRLPLPLPVAPTSATVPIETLDRYLGEYRTAGGSVWRMTREGNVLWFDPLRAQRMQLHVVKEHAFVTRSGRSMEFIVGESGPATEVVMRFGTQEYRAARVIPAEAARPPE
jgi:D-alanyl-D-alanine-carboxypeptidase/D-alanyl-D-alanine-endopeptidase